MRVTVVATTGSPRRSIAAAAQPAPYAVLVPPVGSDTEPLAIRDTGEGPPLVLFHAFPLDSTQWDHQVAAWSDRYRCLRPDLYGCGASPPPWPGMTLDAVADALLQALQVRGVERFAAVGLSLGGYLAMAIARRARHRLAGLVLAATRAAADDDPARAARRAMAERVRRQGVEAIVEETVARLLGPRARDEAHVTDPLRGRIRRWTAEGVAAWQEAMAARPDATAALRGARVPTLCVAGADDVVVSLEEMRALADTVGAQLVVVPDSGHLVNLEQPHRFTEVVGEFLDRTYYRP